MPIFTFIEPIPKDCVLCDDNTPASYFAVNVGFFGGKAGCYCKKHAKLILEGTVQNKNNPSQSKSNEDPFYPKDIGL